MIEHVVVVKAKPGKDAQVSDILAAFTQKVADLPGLVEISAGPNFHRRSQELGVTHGLLVRFIDRDSLDAYQSHPLHADLLPQLSDTCVERVVLDWEVAT
jgi:quinol monooxygenase YgiN